MIDLSGGFRVESVAGVLLFPDSRVPRSFYAFPERPRLANDEQGRPAMKLMLYGKRDITFEVTGGLFACTLSLRVTPRERELLNIALGPAPVTWQQMLWLKGECELRLTAHTKLTGEPSLYGDNDCVMQTSLSTDAARQLEQALRDGLPHNHARYQMTAPPPLNSLRIEGELDFEHADLNRFISVTNLA